MSEALALLKLGAILADSKRAKRDCYPRDGHFQLFVGLRNDVGKTIDPGSIQWHEYPIVHSEREPLEEIACAILRHSDVVAVRIELVPRKPQ